MTKSIELIQDAKQFLAKIDPTASTLSAPDSPSKTNPQGEVTLSDGQVREVHHHHHSSPYSWYSDPYWYYHPTRPVIINNDPTPCYKSSTKSSSDSDSDQAKLIIAIAAIIALITSYFIGKDVGSYSESGRKIRSLDAEELEDPKVEKVVDTQKKMLQDIHSSSRTGIALKTGLAVSAVAAGAGAFLAAPVTLAAGAIGAGVSAAALLAREGYNNADTTQAEDAAKLQQAIVEAQ